MKIVIAAPYVYYPNDKVLCRNKTGFGIMVNKIFNTIREHEPNCKLLSLDLTGRNTPEGVVKHTAVDILKKVNFKYLVQGIRYFFHGELSLKQRIKYCIYCFDKGFIEDYLLSERPDVVNIHGIGTKTISIIEVCDKLNIKYIVTLHGLYSNDKNALSPSVIDRRIEREFIIDAFSSNIPMSVISTGIKKEIEKEYLNGEVAKNVRIILNGTEGFNELHSCSNSDDYFTICSIGNLTKGKNHIQIIRACELLCRKKKIRLIIVGEGNARNEIEKYIDEHNLELIVELKGFVDHVDLPKIIKHCNLNVLASIKEGFGLSIIEGYSMGIPAVFFSDIDAANDISSPDATIMVETRSDEALADAINYALEKKWEMVKIQKFAETFSLEKMAKEYITYFNDILMKW